MDTVLIELTNKKALALIYELEELNLIKVLKETIEQPKTKLSDKYRGVFSKEDATNFNDHTKVMRHEWDNI
jgi:hypothetical protein